MPKYYFHAEDGRRYPDEEGTDLPGDDAARVEGVRILAELLRERPAQFWEDESFRIRVTDQQEMTLFVLEVSVVTAPAAAACRL